MRVRYDEYVKYKEIKARAHLAIDCGMNRFGMKRAYLAVINDKIVEAIYTHIYSSDVVYDKIRFIEELANKYNKKVHIGGSIIYITVAIRIPADGIQSRIGCGFGVRT